MRTSRPSSELRRPSNRRTRRQFAAVWVGVAAALGSPRPVAAITTSPTLARQDPPRITGPWAQLDATLAAIQALETSTENQQTLAAAGNVRARVLWAGLGEYARELGNDAMLIDPITSDADRSGAAWTKRVNAVFANVV